MAKQEVDPIRDKKSVIYEFIRVLALIVFHTVMPVKCHNREQLDMESPYVVIANHHHALDPIALAMFIPGRQVIFLAKKELGKSKLINNILSRAHCIMVDRHNTDMNAMRTCMKAIKNKRILMIFPEGTRHHEGEMEQIESGASLIAMRSKAPIIPAYFDGKLRLFRCSHIYVGDPIPYDDLLEEGINADTCERMNERFRETYRKMVSEHPMRG